MLTEMLPLERNFFRSADAPTAVCEAEIEAAGLFGSYARALSWRRGKPGGADEDPTFRLRAASR